ncbi:MAG: hypothetical protein R2912_04970 [Eubacteriales bacterium]
MTKLAETGDCRADYTAERIWILRGCRRLYETAHKHGALLMVGMARMARIIPSQRRCHAVWVAHDLFVHSQHKTMDALTQAASLHLG